MKTQNSNALNGKKVIILGGSSGIGLATAQAAAAAGAEIIMVSSNPNRLTQAASKLPGNTQTFVVDLSNTVEIEQLFTHTGTFDHLVFTAGESLQLGTIAATDVATARAFFELRYWGAFAAVKYGSPHLLPGGSIVLSSGIAGVRPASGWGLGASICSAMEGFTRAMAVELAPIRVNIVSPGIVRTNLWANMNDTDREAMYDQLSLSLPVRQIGAASDIAKAYLYLMQQPFTTGQVLITDGGGVLV